MMKVYLESLGCKLNQSELEHMARQLQGAGHLVVDNPAEADICVLNSCAVTHIAARKTRQALRGLRRANPTARLVVLGCYAQLWPAELASIEGVEVIGHAVAKEDIVTALGLPKRLVSPARPSTRRRTRAFVKVQDGCNNRCTYCVVRLARGPERSRPLEDVLDEVRALAAEGVREIVLTGVHVGAYGRDLGLDLVDLVQGILRQTDIARLRLSSIEPWHLEERFFGLWKDPRLCRHLHLPLQSGCDATLRRMGRRYTTAEFTRLVDKAREYIPDVAITTDIMVGFPGETEEEFAQSQAFVERMEFARIHVFRYSPRPGTPAASFPGQVPAEVSAARSDAMMVVGEASGRAFCRRFIGRVMPVLWERREPESGLWSGLTDNYIRVWTASAEDLHNCLVDTELIALSDDGMLGRLYGQPAAGGQFCPAVA
ncbi:MAG: tRNA (N(6)-L-threonylcarbamoyladenosine(37)-C(2))-methylthiotransferase MtaB [Anaerolineae bacterium]